MSGEPFLELTDMNAYIDEFQVTHDVSIEVGRQESVGLVGRNGAGKTTTFRSIMGLADVRSGSIRYDGQELTDLDAHEIPKLGVGYQPEDRRLFTGMTVEENFRAPVWASGKERGIEDKQGIVDKITGMFTEMENRRSSKVETLSGGEGKMAAIGRALALDPDLLVLDEPLEGLAPVVVKQVKSHIEDLTQRDISVLIAESNVTHVADLVDRMYVIERGEIVTRGPAEELAEDEEVQELVRGGGA